MYMECQMPHCTYAIGDPRMDAVLDRMIRHLQQHAGQQPTHIEPSILALASTANEGVITYREARELPNCLAADAAADALATMVDALTGAIVEAANA